MEGMRGVCRACAGRVRGCVGRARGVRGACAGRVRGCVTRARGVHGVYMGCAWGVREACVGGNKCWYRSLRFIIRIPW